MNAVATPVGDVTRLVRVTEFWGNVMDGRSTECWPWLGYTDDDGYGQFYFDGRMRPAHELAVTFTTGETRAPQLDTCHSCNNPPCCNPTHLRFDTRASNAADAVRAGTLRGRTGKLNPEQVAVIRTRLAHGARQQDLADQFGVSNSLISMIYTGKRHS